MDNFALKQKNDPNDDNPEALKYKLRSNIISIKVRSSARVGGLRYDQLIGHKEYKTYVSLCSYEV